MRTIDLHRERHDKVRYKVIRFLEDNWNTGNRVKIITGHSTKIKKLIYKVLDEYKLQYQEGDLLGVNTGFITVNME